MYLLHTPPFFGGPKSNMLSPATHGFDCVYSDRYWPTKADAGTEMQQHEWLFRHTCDNDGFCDVPLNDLIIDRSELPHQCTNSDFDGSSILRVSTSSLPLATATKSISEPDQEDSISVVTVGMDPPVIRSLLPLEYASHFRAANRAAPIQLTGWRFRDEDADRPSEPLEANTNLSSSVLNVDDVSNADGAGYQRLAPEELPRMYPEWALGLPFFFDDQTDDETKGCCGNGYLTHSTFVRWFIAVISVIGLACVIVGVALGALTFSGSTRLTLCLLMIGVGVVLITVSGLAWRLTSVESTDCLLRPCISSRGITSSLRRHQSGARAILPDRISRVCRRRPMINQYFSDVFQNPDFVWRPPPPSYRTAMRDRNNRMHQRRETPGLAAPSGSPPPTYRSRGEEPNRPSVMAQFFGVSSRPPSYSAVEDPENIQMSVFSQSMVAPPPSGRTSTPIAGLEGLMVDCLRHDDRASLVRNEAASSEIHLWTGNAADCSSVSSAASATDRLTIIDCSEPIPIGFELRRSRRVPAMRSGSRHRRSEVNACPQRQTFEMCGYV